MRKILCAFLGLGLLAAPAPGEGLPAWWKAFATVPRLDTGFVQESESAVFGSLRRQGRLRLAKGGRLRVEYQKGLLLVADGRSFIQYDPETRTAQKIALRSASGDAPLLDILLDPAAVGAYYRARPGDEPGGLVLEPLRANLPRVLMAGEGQLPRRIQWTDPTGARQSLAFQGPRIPAALDPALFTFQAPAGTRWLAPR